MQFGTKRQFVGTMMASGVLCVGLIFNQACTQKALEPLRDAPINQRNNTPADVMSMPDGFSNVAAKCDGPNRVYVVFKSDKTYGSVAVVANDPRCTK